MFKRNKKIYEEHRKKYTISENIEFLEWLNTTIEKGYKLPINLERMQELVDDIAENYPIIYKNPKYIDKQVMAIFLKQLDMFDCTYSTKSFTLIDNYKQKDNKVKSYTKLKLESLIPEDNKELILKIDNETGMVKIDDEIKKYISYNYSNVIKIENLYYYILESTLKYKYDLKELKKSILFYNCNIKLKSEILKMAALKLLYSEIENYKSSYEMTKKFIESLRSELGIRVSIEELDIFSKNNKKEKVKKLNKK